MVEPHSSNFRVITTNFLGVRILSKFTLPCSEFVFVCLFFVVVFVLFFCFFFFCFFFVGYDVRGCVYFKDCFAFYIKLQDLGYILKDLGIILSCSVGQEQLYHYDSCHRMPQECSIRLQQFTIAMSHPVCYYLLRKRDRNSMLIILTVYRMMKHSIILGCDNPYYL